MRRDARKIIVHVFSGFMVWSVSTATNDPEPKEFDKGLIFVKDTDVLLSGDQ
jgi:hypothetical protein